MLALLLSKHTNFYLLYSTEIRQSNRIYTVCFIWLLNVESTKLDNVYTQALSAQDPITVSGSESNIYLNKGLKSPTITTTISITH